MGYQSHSSSDGVVLTQQWHVQLPAPILVAQHRDNERSTTAAVKVQGNRSMRMRHLSPNMALFVAGPASSAIPSCCLCGMCMLVLHCS